MVIVIGVLTPDILGSLVNPAEAPAFKICSCGKHGIIFTANVIRTGLPSKVEARKALTVLKEGFMLNEQDSEVILSAIDASTLPEVGPTPSHLN